MVGWLWVKIWNNFHGKLLLLLLYIIVMPLQYANKKWGWTKFIVVFFFIKKIVESYFFIIALFGWPTLLIVLWHFYWHNFFLINITIIIFFLVFIFVATINYETKTTLLLVNKQVFWSETNNIAARVPRTPYSCTLFLIL